MHKAGTPALCRDSFLFELVVSGLASRSDGTQHEKKKTYAGVQ